MRFLRSLRIVLAVLTLVVAVVLPPAAVVARCSRRSASGRPHELYQGLWLFKIALGLNAVLWLAWPRFCGFSIPLSDRPGNLSQPDYQVGSSPGGGVYLGLVTGLAAALHLGINSGLTYDEIYFAKSMVLKTPFSTSTPLVRRF